MNQTPLRAGIIAAGDGVRLRASHPDLPKPLVPVAGRPLVDWIVGSLEAAGAPSIVMLLNSRGREVRRHLKTSFPSIGWTFLEKDTKSSWESFRLVSRALSGTSARFVISTVDALAPRADVARFAREAATAMQNGADGCLAVTRFVDDEKPLWARLDSSGTVAALGDDAKDGGWVTCGLYGLTRELTDQMSGPESFQKLRDYWIAAVRDGRRIAAIPLGKTLDVDRPEDLEAAERFLAGLQEPIA
ncbi:MAG: NDP-sugar synthase [Elusimicrobia bacterium]|nr:NDP-sugar synthase [Elusimicrobiota bacterium]